MRTIDTFWKLFRERATELAGNDSADTPTYDALLERLHEIDPGLYLEFHAEPGACELIVTAEGDRSLFPLAREIVAAAPAIQGWAIRAFKPKLGCPELVRRENVTIRSADVYLDAFEDDSGELHLDILIPGLDEEDAEDAHNAVLTMMDHAVGEEALVEAVRGTEMRLVQPGESLEELLPFVELAAFLEARVWERGPGH